MNALEEIRRSTRDGRLAHAYILEGDAGKERDRMMEEIVMTILCTNRDVDGRACGRCTACRRVQSGTHEDVVRMEQSGKVGYRVQDVSAFTCRLSMNAYGDRMVGIIPAADGLTEVTQGKLLKTLEEPYPGTVILLAVSNRKTLLDTVRSRCVLLRMEPSDEGTAEAAEAEKLWDLPFFHEYRKAIDKAFKTQDEALAFLDAAEQIAFKRNDIAGVIRIEAARRDIMAGMGWKPALKRLWLELRDTPDQTGK